MSIYFTFWRWCQRELTNLESQQQTDLQEDEEVSVHVEAGDVVSEEVTWGGHVGDTVDVDTILPTNYHHCNCYSMAIGSLILLYL